MKNKERNFVYSDKIQTDIFLETPSNNNEYIAQKSYIHGYDVLALAQKKSFTASLFLLLIGELPSVKQERLLEILLIGFMNLGPRHPAVKSAMVAGVSKANVEHLLPIGLSVAGGKENGALEVSAAMQFIKTHCDKSADDAVTLLLGDNHDSVDEGEIHLAPGFGHQYGSVDELTSQLAALIKQTCEELAEFPLLQWTFNFVDELNKQGYGWLKTGLAGAVFCELGVTERQGVGLFQLLCAPGIFAQGVEQMHKPITAIPMPTDEQHIYQHKHDDIENINE